MYRKIWHKPLHRRKIKQWRQMPLISKIIYYQQPFIDHLVNTWLEPLPFPTILKVLVTFILAIFILLPILYPAIIFIWSYAEVQYIIENHYDIAFPDKLNVLGYLHRLYTFRIANEKYNLFLVLYLERWRIVATAIASTTDYIRLALCLVVNTQ
ncbi:PREDICTED: uncharacterized protein LOC108968773 isoform X1 [Bactrocera latifrons]|uniref:uncharacterized protein LOC108968773 isoform X1 n=2 Tax=Bactrocera latifrons TaxID=174628 RepID=UPI0008DE7137|nr:PREDICTED: uncharacterized protein LOC108968773 isoform X1 [Bactrocera latifrons]